MKRLHTLLPLLAKSLAAATFTIAPGVHHFGAGVGSIANTLTVTTTGAPSSQQRGFVYFTMQGQLNVALPPGVSGTCTGGPCHIFTADNLGGGVAAFGTATAFPSAAAGGNAFAVDPIYSASPSGSNPSVIFDDASLFHSGGVNNVELGTRFQSDAPGYIVGIRFNKPSTDQTTLHTASLWDSSGAQLATVTTSSESGTGWISVMFASPVAITANTVYTASYHTAGTFWYNTSLLRNRDYGTGPVHALATYGGSNGSCNQSDYWPADAQDRPAAGEVGCVDMGPDGSIVYIQNADATTSAFATEGCQCMIGGIGPGPYKFQNNFLSAVGLPWHHDESGGDWMPRADYDYSRNTFHAPLSRLYGHPTSDGMRYSHRQLLEWKGGHRIHLNGNIFDGSWVENNPASVTVVFSSLSGGGISDVNVENNTFKHVAGVLVAPNVIDGVYPQTLPTGRFRFANNLVWDVNVAGPHDGGNYHSYYTSAGHFPDATGWILEGPEGGEDEIVDHNTIVGNQGRVPSLFFLNDTKVEGVQVTNNVLYYSNGYQGLAMDGSMSYPACDNQQRGKNLANCMFPGFVWDHNLLLGDTSQNTMQSWWPGLNNYIPSDPTRIDATGFFQYNPTDGSGNFRLRHDSKFVSGGSFNAADGKDVGADIDKLEAVQGKVTLTGTPVGSITATSAVVAFVAPDSQGCPVDFSSTDPTVINSFTRVPDNGSARVRSVNLAGLTTGTTYYYRVNCAVEQPSGQFRTK